jgi:hypothetical protein
MVLAAVKAEPSVAAEEAASLDRPLRATALGSSGRDGRMLRGAEQENAMEVSVCGVACSRMPERPTT